MIEGRILKALTRARVDSLKEVLTEALRSGVEEVEDADEVVAARGPVGEDSI